MKQLLLESFSIDIKSLLGLAKRWLWLIILLMTGLVIITTLYVLAENGVYWLPLVMTESHLPVLFAVTVAIGLLVAYFLVAKLIPSYIHVAITAAIIYGSTYLAGMGRPLYLLVIIPLSLALVLFAALAKRIITTKQHNHYLIAVLGLMTLLTIGMVDTESIDISIVIFHSLPMIIILLYQQKSPQYGWIVSPLLITLIATLMMMLVVLFDGTTITSRHDIDHPNYGQLLIVQSEDNSFIDTYQELTVYQYQSLGFYQVIGSTHSLPFNIPELTTTDLLVREVNGELRLYYWYLDNEYVGYIVLNITQ